MKKKRNEPNHFNILLKSCFLNEILLFNFALFVIKENLISIIAKIKCGGQNNWIEVKRFMSVLIVYHLFFTRLKLLQKFRHEIYVLAL